MVLFGSQYCVAGFPLSLMSCLLCYQVHFCGGQLSFLSGPCVDGTTGMTETGGGGGGGGGGGRWGHIICILSGNKTVLYNLTNFN